jgi:hypothetical protein
MTTNGGTRSTQSRAFEPGVGELARVEEAA